MVHRYIRIKREKEKQEQIRATPPPLGIYPERFRVLFSKYLRTANVPAATCAARFRNETKALPTENRRPFRDVHGPYYSNTHRRGSFENDNSRAREFLFGVIVVSSSHDFRDTVPVYVR